MNLKAFLSTRTNSAFSLPIVILYVTEGCNLQCLTCSYRQASPDELTLDEIRQLALSLRDFGLKHIVFSGGEPLLRRDFPQICSIFKDLGVKQTLLTNGLLLEKRFGDLQEFFAEIIVSLDGPDARTHDAIRGIASFDLIVRGIRTAHAGTTPLSIRTVVQKSNFRHLPEMVDFARSLDIKRLSFLAADVLSGSFGRDRSGPAAPDTAVALTPGEAVELRDIIEGMIARYGREIRNGFISESAGKLRHIAQYFEALAGAAEFPRNECNAPMVSAVITSTGDIQPCYFLPPFGNIRTTPVSVIANDPQIRSTRKDVRDYVLERCRKCVCTLCVRSSAALFGEF